jgi:ABC-type Fe3+ transport system permease subunit
MDDSKLLEKARRRSDWSRPVGIALMVLAVVMLLSPKVGLLVTVATLVAGFFIWARGKHWEEVEIKVGNEMVQRSVDALRKMGGE